METDLNIDEQLKKIPIKRNHMFFGAEDMNLEMSFAEEYVEHDVNQTVILYQVDLNKTKVNDVYHEAKKDEIVFKTPIELPVIFLIDNAELKAYDTRNAKGYYVKMGKLQFGVLISTLNSYGCDIKRGDYVGVQITPEERVFWVVTDDGKVGSYSNKNLLYGTVPYRRTITCAPIDKNEMNG